MKKIELAEKAQNMGIDTSSCRTKRELALAIQNAEGVEKCYGSRTADCPHKDCSFIKDCPAEAVKTGLYADLARIRSKNARRRGAVASNRP